MNNSDDTIPELIGGISFISNKSNDFEINKKTSDINRENIDSNILSRNHQIPKQLYVKQNIFLVGSNDFQKTDITEREITVEEGQMAKLSNKLISNNDLSNNTIFNIENDFDEDSTNNDISNTTENIDQTKNEHHMLEISRGEKVIHKEKRIIKYTSSLQSPSVKSITKLRQEKNFTSDPTIAPQIILDDEFAKFDKDNPLIIRGDPTQVMFSGRWSTPNSIDAPATSPSSDNDVIMMHGYEEGKIQHFDLNIEPFNRIGNNKWTLKLNLKKYTEKYSKNYITFRISDLKISGKDGYYGEDKTVFFKFDDAPNSVRIPQKIDFGTIIQKDYSMNISNPSMDNWEWVDIPKNLNGKPVKLTLMAENLSHVPGVSWNVNWGTHIKITSNTREKIHEWSVNDLKKERYQDFGNEITKNLVLHLNGKSPSSNQKYQMKLYWAFFENKS